MEGVGYAQPESLYRRVKLDAIIGDRARATYNCARRFPGALLLDIPGMIYDTSNSFIILPEYIIQGFPIYSIDNEMEDEWLYELGMYIKINNYISMFPPSNIVVLDTIIWETEPIYSYTELLSINVFIIVNDVLSDLIAPPLPQL